MVRYGASNPGGSDNAPYVLKKSGASGFEDFQRLEQSSVVPRSCATVDIATRSSLDQVTSALFSTGWGVMGTGELAGNDWRPPCFRTRRRAGERDDDSGTGSESATHA